MSVVINLNEIRTAMKTGIPKREAQIAMGLVPQGQGTGIGWLPKQLVRDMCKEFRKRVKNGRYSIDKYNNQSVMIEGKKFHALAIQIVGDDDPPICPIGLAYGFMIGAEYVFYFISEKHRDTLYDYLMKGME